MYAAAERCQFVHRCLDLSKRKNKTSLSDISGHVGKNPWPTRNHLNFDLTCTGAEKPGMQASIFNQATVGLGQQKIVQISTQLLQALRDPDKKPLDLAKKSFKFQNELFRRWLTRMDMQTKLESSTDSSKFEYVHFFTLQVYCRFLSTLLGSIKWCQFNFILFE